MIEDGAEVEYLITDKNVTIRSSKHLQGNDTFQVYVANKLSNWMANKAFIEKILWLLPYDRKGIYCNG